MAAELQRVGGKKIIFGPDKLATFFALSALFFICNRHNQLRLRNQFDVIASPSAASALYANAVHPAIRSRSYGHRLRSESIEKTSQVRVTLAHWGFRTTEENLQLLQNRKKAVSIFLTNQNQDILGKLNSIFWEALGIWFWLGIRKLFYVRKVLSFQCTFPRHTDSNKKYSNQLFNCSFLR